MKYSKYGNQPIVINGKRYASQREARRAQELQLMQRAGKISDLREQVKYELIPKQMAGGQLVKSCSYIADFVYTDANGEIIVEDAKGFATDVFNIKRKLMLYIHGIWVRTV